MFQCVHQRNVVRGVVCRVEGVVMCVVVVETPILPC